MKLIKFKPLTAEGIVGWYEDPTGFGWVGHPNNSGGDLNNLLIANRNDLIFLGGISDPDPNYSYDEFAIVRLKRRYFLCETSGCSCPSPDETWFVVTEAKSLKQIKKWLIDPPIKAYIPEWASAWATA